MSVINQTEGRKPEEDEDPILVPHYPPTDVSGEKAWHEWMGIAVALTAMLSILAVIVSIVALGSSNTSLKVVTIAGPAAPAAPAAPVLHTEVLGMSIKADDERQARTRRQVARCLPPGGYHCSRRRQGHDHVHQLRQRSALFRLTVAGCEPDHQRRRVVELAPQWDGHVHRARAPWPVRVVVRGPV